MSSVRANPLTGEVVLDAEGKPVRIPGALQGVKAIGWYIEEYGICQVSMNLTDLAATPLHVAFEEVCESAAERGLRVTGSEIVGMVPLRVLREAGEYYLRRQQRSLGVPTAEIIKIAVRSLGLNELAPFDPDQRIIEYAMARGKQRRRLVDRTVTDLSTPLPRRPPHRAAGRWRRSIGVLGAALGTMVANGSAHKRGWDARWEEFSDWAVQGRAILEELLDLVDADSRAFEALMAAYGLPKATEEEREARLAAIRAATQGAIEVPLRTMRAALRSMDVSARDGGDRQSERGL